MRLCSAAASTGSSGSGNRRGEGARGTQRQREQDGGDGEGIEARRAAREEVQQDRGRLKAQHGDERLLRSPPVGDHARDDTAQERREATRVVSGRHL